MFFTFDNKRPRENSDDFHLNPHEKFVKINSKTYSEPGCSTTTIYRYENDQCHYRSKQPKLDKNQCSSESGYVINSSSSANKSKEKFNRHTVHSHTANFQDTIDHLKPSFRKSSGATNTRNVNLSRKKSKTIAELISNPNKEYEILVHKTNRGVNGIKLVSENDIGHLNKMNESLTNDNQIGVTFASLTTVNGLKSISKSYNMSLDDNLNEKSFNLHKETKESNLCSSNPENNIGKENEINNKIQTADKRNMLNPFQIIAKSDIRKRRVILNVGGVRHEALWKTFERLPKSRLGKLRYSTSISEISQLCDDYDSDENEFFFDRNPRSFSSVINFYRTGKLHLVEDMCVLSFHDDLCYWGIHEFYLEPCCQHKYHQKKEAVLEEIRKEEESIKERIVNENFGWYCPSIRKKVWDLMEKPQTSRGARVRYIYILKLYLLLFLLLFSL